MDVKAGELIVRSNKKIKMSRLFDISMIFILVLNNVWLKNRLSLCQLQVNCLTLLGKKKKENFVAPIKISSSRLPFKGQMYAGHLRIRKMKFEYLSWIGILRFLDCHSYMTSHKFGLFLTPSCLCHTYLLDYTVTTLQTPFTSNPQP